MHSIKSFKILKEWKKLIIIMGNKMVIILSFVDAYINDLTKLVSLTTCCIVTNY